MSLQGKYNFLALNEQEEEEDEDEKRKNKFRIQLTRIVGKPRIAAVTRLMIDRFQLNHREVLLLQMVKSAPRLPMLLTVSIGQLQLQLHLCLAFDHHALSGFFDPEIDNN